MDSYLMFLNCPAYTDNNGAARCGLPAEVHYRYTMNSTGGPLESAKISCPHGHHFNGPIDCLTVPEQPPATAAPASSPQPAGQITRPQTGWDGLRSTLTAPMTNLAARAGRPGRIPAKAFCRPEDYGLPSADGTDDDDRHRGRRQAGGR